MSQPPAPPPRFSRLGLYLPFGLLALFAVIWSGIWAFGARRTGEVLDGFMAREAARGRIWSCPERAIGGYPFRLQITCLRPQVSESGPGGPARIATLGGLTIHGRITAPGHYVALLDAPLVVRLEQDRGWQLDWQSARASLRGGAAGFSELSVEVIAPLARVGPGQRPEDQVRAKDFSLHLRRMPGEQAGSDLLLRLGEVANPLLDQITGNAEPMTLEWQASAPGLVLDPAQRIEESLEAWRLARGQARIILAKASKGPAMIDLSGALGLDAERRLEGHLQGRARGLEQVLGGVTQGLGLDLGGAFGRLGGAQGLPVSLAFRNGRLRFGPLPLAVLPPLY